MVPGFAFVLAKIVALEPIVVVFILRYYAAFIRVCKLCDDHKY